MRFAKRDMNKSFETEFSVAPYLQNAKRRPRRPGDRRATHVSHSNPALTTLNAIKSDSKLYYTTFSL